MKIEFTQKDLMACMEESLTFRAVIAGMLCLSSDATLEAIAREVYALDGLIQAIKAVRTKALEVGGDKHKLYSLVEAKKFVERVCNHRPLV